MPKYAVVISADARFLPGVNGQLNAMQYYGMDDIEFHLIHNFPDSNGYIEKAKKVFPFLHTTSVDDFMNESGRWVKAGEEKYTRSLMKFVRWWYPADRLSDYDAICVLDADMMIVNDLTRYFDMIARSDMIGLAKNDYSEAEWFNYDEKRAMQANPPIYCVPFFITGRRAKELFPMFPEYAQNAKKYSKHWPKETTGDMHPVNLTLLHTGMIKDLFPLPATQWVFVETTHVKLARREIAGKRYVGMHPRGDLINVFHRKYWGQCECTRYANGHGPTTRVNGVNNARIFWEMTRFLNTELYLKVDWVWGDYPTEQASRDITRWLTSYLLGSLGRAPGYPLPEELARQHAGILEKEKDGTYKLSEQGVKLIADLGVPALLALLQRWQ